MNQWINHYKMRPHSLFLLDGFGALFSSFLLGVVLMNLVPIFGIPQNILCLLAIIPLFFAALDFWVYFSRPITMRKYLRTIAWLNIFYCCLSLALAVGHCEVISIYGWCYIISEIVLVTLLAVFEIKVSRQL